MEGWGYIPNVFVAFELGGGLVVEAIHRAGSVHVHVALSQGSGGEQWDREQARRRERER